MRGCNGINVVKLCGNACLSSVDISKICGLRVYKVTIRILCGISENITCNEGHIRGFNSGLSLDVSSEIVDKSFKKLGVSRSGSRITALCLTLHPPHTADNGGVALRLKNLYSFGNGIKEIIVKNTDKSACGINTVILYVSGRRPRSVSYGSVCGSVGIEIRSTSCILNNRIHRVAIAKHLCNSDLSANRGRLISKTDGQGNEGILSVIVTCTVVENIFKAVRISRIVFSIGKSVAAVSRSVGLSADKPNVDRSALFGSLFQCVHAVSATYVFKSLAERVRKSLSGSSSTRGKLEGGIFTRCTFVEGDRVVCILRVNADGFHITCYNRSAVNGNVCNSLAYLRINSLVEQEHIDLAGGLVGRNVKGTVVEVYILGYAVSLACTSVVGLNSEFSGCGSLCISELNAVKVISKFRAVCILRSNSANDHSRPLTSVKKSRAFLTVNVDRGL